MDIKDRIVVVTGAAGGIGRALAQTFAKAGAKKIVCAEPDGDGAEARAKRGAGGGRPGDGGARAAVGAGQENGKRAAGVAKGAGAGRRGLDGERVWGGVTRRKLKVKS